MKRRKSDKCNQKFYQLGIRLKYIILLCLFLLLVTLIGCNSPSGKASVTETQDVVEVPAVLPLNNIHNLQGEELLSSIATDIKYIPLETGDESLLRRIAKNNYTYEWEFRGHGSSIPVFI